jgi:GNAT superfamily N-acetyltransferase
VLIGVAMAENKEKENLTGMHGSPNAFSGDMRFTFSESGYESCEQDILAILKKNRGNIQTREYLDWRYLGEGSSILPAIVWVKSNGFKKIGLSGLVFRRYWVDGKIAYIAVSGDTSVELEYRGQGVGKAIVSALNRVIDHKDCYCGFGIPNAVFLKCLTSRGWQLGEPLIAHVLILRFNDKILGLIKSKRVLDLMVALWSKFLNIRQRSLLNAAISLIEVTDVDVRFDYLWSQLKKEGLLIRDRGSSALRWRYFEHPLMKFTFVKIMLKDRFVGFFVYISSDETKVCHVYDLLLLEECLIIPALCALGNKMKGAGMQRIRIVVNEKHPYSKFIRRAGFIKRKEDAFFVTYRGTQEQSTEPLRWFLTLGDKDT